MNTTQLENYANQWLLDNYNLELDIPIEINNRLTRALGRLRLKQYGLGRLAPHVIELSGRLVKNNTTEDIYKILKHELVHFALFTLNKPYKDGDIYFENELTKHNLPSNYRDNLDLNITTPKHHYSCEDCNMSLTRARRINVSYKQYVCGVCGGDLIHKGHY